MNPTDNKVAQVALAIAQLPEDQQKQIYNIANELRHILFKYNQTNAAGYAWSLVAAELIADGGKLKPRLIVVKA